MDVEALQTAEQVERLEAELDAFVEKRAQEAKDQERVEAEWAPRFFAPAGVTPPPELRGGKTTVTIQVGRKQVEVNDKGVGGRG